MTVDEHSIESIFRELGYKSSTDYAVQKMRDELLHELKISLKRVEAFEKKYGMVYDEFFRRFNELTKFGLIEREDDIMDWRVEVHEIRVIEKHLIRLIP